MRLKSLSIIAAVVCALLLGAGSAVAQMEPGSGTKPARVEPKPSTSQPTAPSASKQPADPAGNNAKKTPANTANEQPSETAPSTPAVAKDPISLLLEQIGVTATAQEKATLRLKLVDALVRTGNEREARNQLGQMLAEDRFDPQLFYNIGNAFARLGDIDGAIVSYRKAIEQRKGRYSKALNNLAVVLMRRGEWDQAHEALTTALKLENYRYAEASYNLGRLYAAQGQSDLAIREWHQALKVDPNHVAAAQALARAGGEAQVTVGTVNTAGTVSAITEPRYVSPTTAPTSEVKTVARPPRRVWPALTVDPVTYSLLQHARDAHERGKDQDAIASYRSVISRMGGYFAPANLELSYILVGLRQLDDALIYLKPVTSRDGPRYPIGYYHLARIYEVKNDLEHAAEAYEQAATYYRGVNPQFLLDISRVREKRGDYQGALTAMEEYLKAVEQLGLKPVWSEERLAALRQKIAASK